MPDALPELRGKRVLLRQPVLDLDVAARLEVPADPELHRLYGRSGEPGPVTADGARAMLAGVVAQDPSRVRQFVIAALAWPDGRPIDPPGRFVGQIRLHTFAWADRRARVAVGIHDRRFWSRGYGTEALRLLLGYAFDHLRLHRVDLRVLADNRRAIRSYEKCGFVHEGVEREAALVDCQWRDDALMAILEHEYRARL